MMAIEYVDSTQLNTDLTSVANAIRAKSGGSSALAFPAGFVSEIQAIPSGGGGPHEVPDGYTQLMWLRSSGTQAINTGVAPTLDTQVQVQAFMLEGNGRYCPLAGCTNPILMLCAPSAFNTNGYYSFGNVADKVLYPPWSSEAIPIFTINKTEAKYTIDGFSTVMSVSLGATAMSGSSDTRIFLFARGNAGNYERMSNCQIYRSKIWNNGTLIRDFVPAKRNSDDVLGMYDIVNDVFYTNAGAGVFIGGEYE